MQFEAQASNLTPYGAQPADFLESAAQLLRL